MLVDGVAGRLPEVADDSINKEVDLKVLRDHVKCHFDRDDLLGQERNVACHVPELVAGYVVLRTLMTVRKDFDGGIALGDAVEETHRER